MKSEIIEKISSLHSGKIKYCGGKLSKSQRTLSLEFVTNVAPSDDLEGRIVSAVSDFVPKTISSVSVKVRKVVAADDIVVRAALKWIKSNHSICAGELNEESFSVAGGGDADIILTINAEHSVYEYFLSRKIVDELEAYLATQFVENIEVKVVDGFSTTVDASKLELKLTENDLREIKPRELVVDDVTRLFDNDKTSTAFYMSDVKDYIGDAYIAGVVTNVREMKTKTEPPKPYFIIEFSDRTASMSGTIFPTQAQLPKVQKIVEGSEIIVQGEFSRRNGYHNFRIRSINYCAFPKNFVPKPRPKRPVPKEYSLIFPQKLVIEKQENFLVEDKVPDCFLGRTFVIFDLETTGTDMDDKITEIGAVKMVDGKFETYFDTLVNPQKHISAEVEKLTGISDDMVKDAPIYEKVCADFYKYCEGATLVAHNIDFDSRFIRVQSQPLDYVFDHPLLDTLALGRECITGVSNYKLNTLCEKFGIVFNHHRAYSDALACAKLLIEIMKIRKEFP